MDGLAAPDTAPSLGRQHLPSAQLDSPRSDPMTDDKPSETITAEIVPLHSTPTLEEVIRALFYGRRIAHLTLVPSRDECQVSFREQGGSGYRVEIKGDPIDALMAALGPRWGETWEHHLKNPSPRAAPKTKSVRKRAEKKENPDYDPDIEDLL